MIIRVIVTELKSRIYVSGVRLSSLYPLIHLSSQKFHKDNIRPYFVAEKTGLKRLRKL